MASWSVLGAGGLGKSSLALAAAHARCHARRAGAVWLDLSSIFQPAHLCAVVARALHLPVARGDRLLPALVAGLKSLDVLIVLDNAEHLVDDVARMVDAIAAGRQAGSRGCSYGSFLGSSSGRCCRPSGPTERSARSVRGGRSELR